jgi:choline dehydrogenase-like flavoprotein
LLSRLRGAPNLVLLTGAEVVGLIGAPQSPHRIGGVRLKDGRELYAGSVLLAAGALHSPRLLQRYLTSAGIADTLLSADAIGRYLKLHLLTALVAVSATHQRDLIRKTRVFLNPALPHSSVQPLGFDGALIGTLVPKLVPRALARQIGTRAYGFFLQTEDGAHRDNCVSERPGTDPAQPVMDYDPARSPSAVREHARLVADFRSALLRAGMISFAQRIGNAGTAHVSGTLIAGSDPASSVVAPDGHVHGMQSLYVVDGSILPRSSRVNPSLTIYAWSLRVAHLIASRQHAARSVIPEVVS